MSQESIIPSEWSLPFVERGDVVQLKQPYQPDWSLAHEPLKRRLQQLLYDDSTIKTPRADTPEDIPLPAYRDSEAAQRYLAMTHGTVVEIVSRYSAGTYDLNAATPYLSGSGSNRARRPVRNVELHLYNPSTGLVYFDSGTGSNGIPTYVQEHTANHVLIQKHDNSYGPLEVDIGAAHRELGIREATGFDPMMNENTHRS